VNLDLSRRHANIVGCGLIGGSIGLALRARGWHVSGTDLDPAVAGRALELGALDSIGSDPDATITFVAAPVGAIPALAKASLDTTQGAVTDVGGVKAGIVGAVGGGRFIGGHPMAGSEQLGVDGADPDLFQGAVWVLTPVAHTDPECYALVRSVVSDLGAEVIALAPERHDDLVAVVSHVPHLTATAMMRLAAARAEEHQPLLRLAAGGFRDMTRIAAGSPSIWPDICAENRDAICTVIDSLIASLGELRDTVARSDRDGLLHALTEAQAARRNLPSRVSDLSEVAELRVPVADRVGVIAEVTTLATELGVNIADVDLAHSSEGDAGVVVVLVDSSKAEAFREGLVELGYRPALRSLE
jgi:prephenate dehydrogenase